MKLSEGLIKLPTTALKEMRSVMLKWYFAYVERVAPKRFSGSDLVEALRIISDAKAKYGVRLTPAEVEHGHQRSRTQSFHIDEEVYGSQLDMTVTMRLIFDKDEGLGRSSGSYDEEDGPFIKLSPFNLRMTGPSIGTLSALKASLAKMPQLIGLLEHELTHLVQYQALHPAQTAYHAKYDEYDDDYKLSQLEFDPHIKSALGKFKQLQAKYKAIPGYNASELASAFVGAEGAPTWMNPDDASGFFDTLYHRAPVRWKKAVKLFMHELSVS